VRRSLGTRKVGHAGTLDPMATGLLLVGVGRATRLLRFLSGLDKAYEGAMRLGEETDTLDATGVVTRRGPFDHVTREDVERAMRRMVGDMLQAPPAYSAVKVGGRALHRAARAGEPLEAEPRAMRVDAFELLSFDGSDVAFRVACSSGTYVRMLVADLGRAVGSVAHLVRLNRTRVGPFSLDDATPLEDIGEPLPIEEAVRHLPRLDLLADEAAAAANGRPLGPAAIEGPYAVFDPAGRLVAVYRDEHAKAVPVMVLAPTSS
jgi:tRNA pseudouridine55 synthase